MEVMVEHIEPHCCFHSKASVIDTNVHLISPVKWIVLITDFCYFLCSSDA